MQTERTSVGLRLAELEQNLEDTRAREHGLLGKTEALEQRVVLLEEARDALKKEYDGAVALLEDSYKEQEAEKQRRIRTEASLEIDRTRYATELERLRLDHAAELVEIRREMELLRTERDQARDERQQAKDELEKAREELTQAREEFREAQERQTVLSQQARAALAALTDVLDRLVGAGEARDKKG